MEMRSSNASVGSLLGRSKSSSIWNRGRRSLENVFRNGTVRRIGALINWKEEEGENASLTTGQRRETGPASFDDRSSERFCSASSVGYDFFQGLDVFFGQLPSTKPSLNLGELLPLSFGC